MYIKSVELSVFVITDYTKQNIFYWEMLKPHDLTLNKAIRIDNGVFPESLNLNQYDIIGTSKVDRTYSIIGSSNSSDTTKDFFIEGGIIKSRDTALMYSVYGINSTRTVDS